MRIDLIFAPIFAIGLGCLFFCMAKIEDERCMKISFYCGAGAMVILAIVTVIAMVWQP